MQVQDYDTSTSFVATVVSTQRMTPETTDEVREIVLDVANNGLDVAIGQSIGVIAPGDPSMGQEQHVRLYSVSDRPQVGLNDSVRLTLAVKRCFYVDDYSGEKYPGRASNYLCDLQAGAEVTLAGPFGLPFKVPTEPDALVMLIATSTGIAPFRAFVRHLFEEAPEFKGRVMLFYGGRWAVDLVYLNDARDDFERYRDGRAFHAYEALSTRPHWTDEIDWQRSMAGTKEAIKQALEAPRTWVYVAGLLKDQEGLHDALGTIVGDAESFARRRAEMGAGGRWVEVLY